MEAAANADRGRFFRLVFAVATIFFVGSLLAIARIAWALAHAVVWVNYRGSTLSHGDMYTAMGLCVVVALCSIGIVVLVRKSLRRPQ